MTAPTLSLFGGSINLLNSIIGAGILTLPFAYRQCGVFIAMIYQFLFALTSWYGLHLLLLSIPPDKPPSYERLSELAFGRGGWYLYSITAFISSYGSCITYIIVIGDELELLGSDFGISLERPYILSTVVAFLIFPLSVMRNIASLRWASGLAIAIYCIFVTCLIVIRFVEPSQSEMRAFPGDAQNVFEALPLFVYGLACHKNLFPIYQETISPTQARMQKLIAISVSIATVSFIFLSSSHIYSSHIY